MKKFFVQYKYMVLCTVIFVVLSACASTEAVPKVNKTKVGNDFDAELGTAKQSARRSLLKDSFDYQSFIDLHYAAGWGSKDLVEHILQQDSSEINARDRDGRTPLFLAAGFNKAEVVEFLLAEGAELEAENKAGTRPIHMAASFNSDLATLEAVVEAGADVRRANNLGSTPLHWAAGAAAVEQSKLLIKSGASVNVKDNKGLRPIDIVDAPVLKDKSPAARKKTSDYLRALR